MIRKKVCSAVFRSSICDKTFLWQLNGWEGGGGRFLLPTHRVRYSISRESVFVVCYIFWLGKFYHLASLPFTACRTKRMFSVSSFFPLCFYDLKKPPPTQLKTTTVRPIYPDTCPFHYYFRSILIIHLTPYSFSSFVPVSSTHCHDNNRF